MFTKNSKQKVGCACYTREMFFQNVKAKVRGAYYAGKIFSKNSKQKVGCACYTREMFFQNSKDES